MESTESTHEVSTNGPRECNGRESRNSTEEADYGSATVTEELFKVLEQEAKKMKKDGKKYPRIVYEKEFLLKCNMNRNSKEKPPSFNTLVDLQIARPPGMGPRTQPAGKWQGNASYSWQREKQEGWQNRAVIRSSNWQNRPYKGGGKTFNSTRKTDYNHKFEDGDDERVGNEKEPEWFSEGPSSQRETVELCGFPDDDRLAKNTCNESAESNPNKSTEPDLILGHQADSEGFRPANCDLNFDNFLELENIPGLSSSLEDEQPKGMSRFTQFFQRNSDRVESIDAKEPKKQPPARGEDLLRSLTDNSEPTPTNMLNSILSTEKIDRRDSAQQLTTTLREMLSRSVNQGKSNSIPKQSQPIMEDGACPKQNTEKSRDVVQLQSMLERLIIKGSGSGASNNPAPIFPSSVVTSASKQKERANPVEKRDPRAMAGRENEHRRSATPASNMAFTPTAVIRQIASGDGPKQNNPGCSQLRGATNGPPAATSASNFPVIMQQQGPGSGPPLRHQQGGFQQPPMPYFVPYYYPPPPSMPQMRGPGPRVMLPHPFHGPPPPMQQPPPPAFMGINNRSDMRPMN